MAISVRVEPIDRDVRALIDETLSPEARSRELARFAREQRDEALAINRQALGREPRTETFVDGRRSAALEAVKPEGEIVFEFDLLIGLFTWIAAELVKHSPVGGPPSPAYRENHVLFADGVEIDPAKVPEATAYTFVNTVPYARKIERGRSPQAPDGVYQVVAALAKRRFGALASIRFSDVSLAGGDRQPAIVIKPQG